MSAFSRLVCLSLMGLVFIPAWSSMPNFIVILTDDQGYNDLGTYGSPKIKTPNLDQMANEGVRFTDFYVAHNVCSASRAALLTGSHHIRFGGFGVLHPNSKTGLHPQEVTLADLMKRKGYATACVGKWHQGDAPIFLPTRQGFDSYFGIPYSNDMYYNKTYAVLDPNVVLREGWTQEKINATSVDSFPKESVPLMRDGRVIEFPVDQTTLTRRYTDEALMFIAKGAKSQTPFFLYLAHSMPHVPLHPSAAFAGKSARGPYGDVIQEIDFNVGRILDTLKALGIDKNTLIVYTSDNGPWLDKRALAGSAFPLRDGKFSDWEGGQRVPGIMRWPGHIPAGLVQNEVASTLDILPTLAHIAGIPLPTDKTVNGKKNIIDGVNILSLLEGKPRATRGKPFFYDTKAMRLGDFKLVHDSLYNLKLDIGETQDLSLTNPAQKVEMKRLLLDFQKSLVDRGVGTLTSPEPVGGCTNVSAANFNILAGRDDGSCLVSVVTFSPSLTIPASDEFQVVAGLREIRLTESGRIEVFNFKGILEWNDHNVSAMAHSYARLNLGRGLHWLRISKPSGARLHRLVLP